MKIPGCVSGLHSDIKPVKPKVPVKEDVSSAPVRVMESKGVEPAVAVPDAVIETPKSEQTEFVTPSGLRKCRHAGCMKEYDPAENSVTACEYHEGKAGFRDTKKFWSCCEASSYDWEEFMKIPKCKVGPHEPKMVDVQK